MVSGSLSYSYTTYNLNGSTASDTVSGYLTHDKLRDGIIENNFNQISTKDSQDLTHLGFGVAYNKNSTNWILAINKKWWKDSSGIDFIKFAVKRDEKDIKMATMHNISDIIKPYIEHPETRQTPVNMVIITTDDKNNKLVTLFTFGNVPIEEFDEETGEPKFREKDEQEFNESIEKFKQEIFGTKERRLAYDERRVNNYFGISNGPAYTY